MFSILYLILETFLNYHPNVAATGETSFFENDAKYKQGIMSYLKQMPEARYNFEQKSQKKMIFIPNSEWGG